MPTLWVQVLRHAFTLRQGSDLGEFSSIHQRGGPLGGAKAPYRFPTQTLQWILVAWQVYRGARCRAPCLAAVCWPVVQG